MNIIVTLAGHSRRFQKAGYKEPKPFIQVGSKKMIEHVVDMFSPDDKFFFVVNSQQKKEWPDHVSSLKKLAPRCEVVVIEPHEVGPTYSALQVTQINDDEPVIVTYCDFTVDWNYKQFLRLAQSCDAICPTFKDFQPASFGHTFYAYVKANGNEFIELREKQSWTNERWKEPASTGIYYFREWKNFKKYGQQIVDDKSRVLPEAYTSLLLNPMKQDGFDIRIFEVERFICLGTPEDLSQYLFWWNYFQNEKQYLDRRNLLESGRPNSINLLPMAGLGSRFKTEGYRVTKPLIQVGGRPMIFTACSSFPPADKWVFLIRDTELEKHPIQKAIDGQFRNSHVVPVKELTSGQAVTCLLAKSEWTDDSELFIASCDYQTVFDINKWNSLINDTTVDVVIWTYHLGANLFKNPNAFAYCRVASDGETVTEIVEKKTISDTPENDHMVVGSFWYRRAQDFVEGTKQMIDKGITVNGEHYVGTSINQLILSGKKVKVFLIKQWISFGDPFELKVYEFWEDHFA